MTKESIFRSFTMFRSPYLNKKSTCHGFHHGLIMVNHCSSHGFFQPSVKISLAFSGACCFAWIRMISLKQISSGRTREICISWSILTRRRTCAKSIENKCYWWNINKYHDKLMDLMVFPTRNHFCSTNDIMFTYSQPIFMAVQKQCETHIYIMYSTSLRSQTALTFAFQNINGHHPKITGN